MKRRVKVIYESKVWLVVVDRKFVYVYEKYEGGEEMIGLFRRPAFAYEVRPDRFCFVGYNADDELQEEVFGKDTVGVFCYYELLDEPPFAEIDPISTLFTRSVRYAQQKHNFQPTFIGR